ncbi:hypothetical protein BD410DRAFT_727524 [Rickenella mellea]|uniref:Uncharacterized protein n=1 Tax=Rickenella mellea TaxID=50990 RepID=A0A4Y7PVI1_9AGAM|nr:hypothetical protein BD410DRAFT_727524 [Rickenella mellea]
MNTEEWHHPRLTGYRIIILVLTVIFGIWKAALMYMGQNIAPNMLDWEFGVVCITGLYWLGWYEKSHPAWMGWIFAENYYTGTRAPIRLFGSAR